MWVNSPPQVVPSGQVIEAMVEVVVSPQPRQLELSGGVGGGPRWISVSKSRSLSHSLSFPCSYGEARWFSASFRLEFAHPTVTCNGMHEDTFGHYMQFMGCVISSLVEYNVSECGPYVH